MKVTEGEALILLAVFALTASMVYIAVNGKDMVKDGVKQSVKELLQP